MSTISVGEVEYRDANPYYRRVRNHTFLEHDDLLELSRRWRTSGDYEARNSIIVHNLRLVMRVAKSYERGGIDYDALVAAGNEGLIEAAEKFDPERGIRFNWFAPRWIRKHILLSIENRHVVSIPRAISWAHSKHGEPVISLGEPAHGPSSESTATVGDYIPDEGLSSPTTAIEAREALEASARNIRVILAAVNALPIEEWHKTVFKMYWGLEGHPQGLSFNQISKDRAFKVCSKRIQFLVKDIWKKLDEHGVNVTEEDLTAELRRVQKLEEFVGDKTDVTSPIEDLVLGEIAIEYQPAAEVDGDVPLLIIRPRVNLKGVKPGTATPDEIIRVVSQAYGTTPETILGDKMPRKMVWIRHVCAYIMRKKLKSSFADIGRALNYAEHSTACYGYKVIMKAVKRDESRKEEIQKIIPICGFV